MILLPDCAWQIYVRTVCEIWGEKLVKCLQSLAKLPISPNQNYFWKKESSPVTSYLRAWSTQGYKTDPHWIIFPECCHNFWVLKTACLPAGRLKHTPSLELWLEYTLPLRPLMAAKKNHRPPISFIITVSNLTQKNICDNPLVPP